MRTYFPHLVNSDLSTLTVDMTHLWLFSISLLNGYLCVLFCELPIGHIFFLLGLHLHFDLLELYIFKIITFLYNTYGDGEQDRLMRGEVMELTGQGARRVTFPATETTKNYDRSEYVVENSLHTTSEPGGVKLRKQTSGTKRGYGWHHLHDIIVKSRVFWEAGRGNGLEATIDS